MHASSKQSLIILSPHRLTTSLSLSHTHPSSPSHSSLSHTHPLTFSLPHTHLIPRPLTFSLPPSHSSHPSLTPAPLTFSLPPSHPSPSPSHSLPPHLTPSLTLISSLPHTPSHSLPHTHPSSPLECSRRHQFCNQYEDLSFLLVSVSSDLPGVVQSEDVWVLQVLKNGHLLLEPRLFRLVVAILLCVCVCV